MKGIVLAGGTGSRLWPITKGISKHLIPVYDKPLIYYPIGTLFLAGIREILVITTPEDQPSFQRLLGDGSQFGVHFSFQVQIKPNGIAEAFLIGENFIANQPVTLILGDNIFHGVGLGEQLRSFNVESGANIFAQKVPNPEQYGVVEFSEKGEVLSLEEKPSVPRSPYAVPGLYFYDSKVTDIAKEIHPSNRGEIEITTVNQMYLNNGELNVSVLNRGTSWFDSGTFGALHDASSFIRVIEERQGNKVSCLEEIAWKNGWISDNDLMVLARKHGETPYGAYIKSLIQP